MTLKRKVKIVATGSYLPKNIVTSEDLDKKLKQEKGWAEAKSGVKTRHFAGPGENAAQMAAAAIREALKEAKMTIDDIDCIVATSGTMDQAIPCNAVLIKKELEWQNNIPAFDINATCVSFLHGLDLIADTIELGKYKNVILVSSDIASVGLDWNHPESCLLFGDGAAAVILTQSSVEDQSCLHACHFENYIEGADHTQIEAGSRNHASKFENFHDFLPLTLFSMKGKEVFKLAAKTVPSFMDKIYQKAGVKLEELSLMIPHQASGSALKLVMRIMGFTPDKYVYLIPELGNQIAVSVPMGLHLSIKQNRIKRGDKIVLFGTGAGFTLATAILTY